MRCVIDVTQTATCTREVIVEADNVRLAAVAAEIVVERALGRKVYLDREDWDTIELDGELETSNAEQLLDRRTRERRELGARSDAECDSCDATPVRTTRYGDARVCSVCLSKLPPLSG